MKRQMLRFAVARLATAAAGFSAAHDVRERALKSAAQNPKGHPIVMGMEKFAELVAARSGGKIKVNLFPGGVLSAPDLDGRDRPLMAGTSAHATLADRRRPTFGTARSKPAGQDLGLNVSKVASTLST